MSQNEWLTCTGEIYQKTGITPKANKHQPLLINIYSGQNSNVTDSEHTYTCFICNR